MSSPNAGLWRKSAQFADNNPKKLKISNGCDAPPTKVVDTVGAGDSFLAAMVFALCTGQGDHAAFCMGLAAGTAAVLNPGTDLARPADIARLLNGLATP